MAFPPPPPPPMGPPPFTPGGPGWIPPGPPPGTPGGPGWIPPKPGRAPRSCLGCVGMLIGLVIFVIIAGIAFYYFGKTGSSSSFP